LASCAIGSARSASAPSSAIATVRLASDGEIALATSKPVMPWGIRVARHPERLMRDRAGSGIFNFLCHSLLRSKYPGHHGLRRRQAISPSLAKRTVAMALDGALADLADPIAHDAKIEFVNRDDPRALE